MSTNVSQLQQQLIIAEQAKNAGQITLAQYTAFAANQNQLIANATSQLQASQKAANVTPATVSTVPAVYSAGPSPVTAPLGVDPQSTQAITKQAMTNNGPSLLVNTNYQVMNKQVTDINGQKLTEYTLAPKNQQAVQTSPLTNDVFTGKGLNFLGQTAQQTKDKQMIFGAVITAGIALPAVGVTAAISAAGIGLGVSQGIKTTQYALAKQDISQSLLTPLEAVEAAAGSIVFAGVGGAVNQALKITGSGLLQSVARIGVNTAIGAAGGGLTEAVQTGKVTENGVITGAVFGLGFGAIGEAASGLNAKYDFAGKLSDRTIGPVQDVIISRNSDTIDSINTKFKDAYNNAQAPNYSNRESFVMKIAGVTPDVPNGQNLFLKTIPTANTEDFETYKGFGKQNVEYELPITNTKGNVVDMLSIKDTVDVQKTFIREKEPSNIYSEKSLTELSLKQQTLETADYADIGTTLYGKSEAPEAFYAKSSSKGSDELAEFKPVKQIDGDFELGEITQDRSLSFKKSADDLFREQQTPSLDKVLEPSKMIKGRTDAFQDLGMANELATPYEFSVKKGEPLSFAKGKTINSIKDLQDNIDLFQEIPQGDIFNDKAIFKANKNTKTVPSQGDFMYRETSSQQLERSVDFINRGGVAQGGKAKVTNYRDTAIMNELTGKTDNVTGQQKYFEDLKLGQPVANTAKVEVGNNPFLGYGGRSYYQQRQRETEDTELTYVSYPNSGLRQPTGLSNRQQPSGITGLTGRVGSSQNLMSDNSRYNIDLAVPFSSMDNSNRNGVATPNLQVSIRAMGQDRNSLNIFSNPMLAHENKVTLRTFPIVWQPQDQTSTTDITPIFTYRTTTPQKPTQGQTELSDNFLTQNKGFSFPDLGSKSGLGGGSGSGGGKKSGLKSYKFVNPILTGFELVGAKTKREDDPWGF